MPSETQRTGSFLAAVEAALAHEDEGYARYRRARRRIKDDARFRPAPLEYDESGFPLPSRAPGPRATRVAHAQRLSATRSRSAG